MEVDWLFTCIVSDLIQKCCGSANKDFNASSEYALYYYSTEKFEIQNNFQALSFMEQNFPLGYDTYSVSIQRWELQILSDSFIMTEQRW